MLTVRAHTAASHAKKGWERFTDAVISQLSSRRQGVVFLLWGRYAQVGVCCWVDKMHEKRVAAGVGHSFAKRF